MNAPLNLEKFAKSAYENSTLYRRPWERLTASERAAWLRTVAHLATPKDRRRGRVTALLARVERAA